MALGRAEFLADANGKSITTHDKNQRDVCHMSAPSTQGPHPLAERLIERYLASGLSGPVLEVAAGVGRNTRAFEAAGIPIAATGDDDPYTQLPGERDSYAAGFSSHGYLHGATAKVRAGLAELRRVLRPGAPIYITLGSIHDDRARLLRPRHDRRAATRLQNRITRRSRRNGRRRYLGTSGLA
jgi:hypothetical protein